MMTIVPPIKSQGIKTKLVPWINDIVYRSGLDLAHTNWIEPFFGTGVVGLNAPIGGSRYVADSNPHIINFYNGVLNGEITPQNMRTYLEYEGKILSEAGEEGYEHYRKIRNRFNSGHSPFDFIFLSRAGFNGMMRFNRRGEWNIPFCKKPNRFAPAYVTKICNQIEAAQRVIHQGHWEFHNQGFIETIAHAQAGALFYALQNTPAHFILSTWHHNEFRANDMMDRFWNNFNVETQEHFYQAGGHLENRHAMVEALVFNFDLQAKQEVLRSQQLLELQLDFAI